jgi:hypothetical protein
MQSPIAVTIKNKGDSILTLATIYYSLNGGTPKRYNWTGNLLWDFNRKDTLDYYYPKMNGQDTFVVWVEMPNGIADAHTWDDTLTKIVYGCSDILMSFIIHSVDTVANTGPFEISARIYTLSGISSGITLDVVTTYNGVNTPSSIPMTFEAINNLWKTVIPRTQYGSKVIYSITMTDILGNVVSIADSFFIKRRETGGADGWQYAGDTNSTALNYSVPFDGGDAYGWSQEIILASEINSFGQGGTITIASYFPTGMRFDYPIAN